MHYKGSAPSVPDLIAGHVQVMIEPYAHRALRGVRVLRDVGQRLGHDPVAGHLRRRGQIGQAAAGSVQGDLQGGGLAVQAPDLLAQGTGQAELIQRGRPQPVDDAPHVGHGPLGLRLEPGQEALQLRQPR